MNQYKSDKDHQSLQKKEGERKQKLNHTDNKHKEGSDKGFKKVDSKQSTSRSISAEAKIETLDRDMFEVPNPETVEDVLMNPIEQLMMLRKIKKQKVRQFAFSAFQFAN